MIDKKIFKAYDIRGTYPDQLNEEAAFAIGRALALRAKAIQVSSVVVGSDMRLSGPVLKKELIKGIIVEGINVVDIGLVPIDAVYACVGKFGYEAAVMITASHNPAEYNGFKMVMKNMQWIRGIELKDEALNLPELEANIPPGIVSSENIYPKYIEHILSFVQTEKIKPFKVVVDAGNGLAGKVVPKLSPFLPIEIVPLNFKLDGSFPAHPSNPLLPASQVQISEAVKKHKADFGVIFDGDTDRLFFVDEKGKFIRADITLLLLAKLFLDKEPGSGIVYNVICSRIVPEKIKEWQGRPLRSPAGYINIAQTMKENEGIMGGELSAHYSFRDNAHSDSGFIAWLIMLQLLSSHSKPLSEIVQPFYKYEKSPEINLQVDDIEAKLDLIKINLSDGQQDYMDGVTVEYDDWWVNVRPSNTEPLLRVTIEAANKDLLDKKTKQVMQILQG